MPWSANTWDDVVKDFIIKSFSSLDTNIIDIGPGKGKYGRLLGEVDEAEVVRLIQDGELPERDHLYWDSTPACNDGAGYTIDALEIFEPYIEVFGLKKLYNEVYVGDVCTSDILNNYDVMIMGDVLEHLSVDEAKKCLSHFKGVCIITVPFLYEQPLAHPMGNKFEIHIQDDLTHDLMIERYNVTCLAKGSLGETHPFTGESNHGGVYIKEKIIYG